MKRLVVVLGLCFVVAAPAFGWSDATDEFVAAMNMPDAKQETGIQEVRRPEKIANRLEVVFQEQVSADQRARVLRKIGQQFLLKVFEERRIPTVIVVERDATGMMRDHVIVSLIGTPSITPPATARTRNGPSC